MTWTLCQIHGKHYEGALSGTRLLVSELLSPADADGCLSHPQPHENLWAGIEHAATEPLRTFARKGKGVSLRRQMRPRMRTARDVVGVCARKRRAAMTYEEGERAGRSQSALERSGCSKASGDHGLAEAAASADQRWQAR